MPIFINSQFLDFFFSKKFYIFFIVCLERITLQDIENFDYTIIKFCCHLA